MDCNIYIIYVHSGSDDWSIHFDRVSRGRDTLYRDMTPFVITTNSDFKDVSTRTDKPEQRLFTRIFERCPTPIYISDAGGSIRGEKTVQSKKRYRELLNIAPNA